LRKPGLDPMSFDRVVKFWNSSQRFGGEEPDSACIGIDDFDQDDGNFRVSNRESSDGLAVGGAVFRTALATRAKPA
jgi:hypothetical protein